MIAFRTTAETRPSLVDVCRVLDDAFLDLRLVTDPAADVAGAERHLAAALLHTYRALAAAGDARTCARETALALVRARDAHALLDPLPSDDAQAEAAHIAVAIQMLGMSPAPTHGAQERAPTGGHGPSVLRASVGELHMLALDREVLYPAVPLPQRSAPPPAPTPDAASPLAPVDMTALVEMARAQIATLSDMDAPPTEREPHVQHPLDAPDDDAIEREYLGTQLDERAVMLERATAAAEDLAAFGMMRAALPQEGWKSAEHVEQRLLARVDALAACGAWVLPHLVKLLEHRPVPDPDLTWALLVLFGSIAGSDALDQALRIAKAADLEADGMKDRIEDAFSIAPHPGIDRAMRHWLTDPAAGRRAIGIAVLGRRGAATAEEVARAAADADAAVVLAATAALGRAHGQVGALLLDRLLHHDASEIVRAAMVSAVERRSPQGLLRATELVAEGRGDYADAAVLAAVCGDTYARDLLRDQAGGAAWLEAAGWCGDLECVEALLGELGRGEPSTRQAAACALQMLTGAGLTERCPAPAYAPGDLPFSERRASPAAAEPEGPLLLDAQAWARWWAQHGGRARRTARYRFGRPWSPWSSVAMLRHPACSARVRSLARLELVARIGQGFALDVRDFVHRQERDMDDWLARHARALHRVQTGTWRSALSSR